MNISGFARSSSRKQVKHQKMPDYFFDNMPDPEYLWLNAEWVWSTRNNNGIQRSYKYHTHPTFPSIFADMMDWLRCEDISMFIGHCEGANDALNWHWDDYHVWAFNVEGVTEWQWFDPATGQIEKQVLEPGYILTMPYGITHQVRMISETRTSVSMITQYGGKYVEPPDEDYGKGWNPPSQAGK